MAEERKPRPHSSPRTGHTRPLAVAARTLAAASGLEETVVDVVHGRAIRHYREGLRQYLSIRLGSVERAGGALGELRATAVATPSDELAAPPGVRAHLYHWARQIALRRSSRGEVGTPSSLPWRPPRAGEEETASVHARLRSELDAAEAEILELRHARELTPEEISFVVERPEAQVEADLARVEERVRAWVGPERDVREVVLEAFALSPADAPKEDVEPEDDWEPLAPGTIVGERYSIEKRVGSGSFGDVYRAQDTEVPGHVVALKLLHQTARTDEARRVALRELHLIASVFHPSVVQFKDHGWYEDRMWFVMPWYEGETLEALIERRPLERPEARRIFEPLARALATMHAAGIRHQDVKPENIFLARIRGFGQFGEGDEVLPVLIDLGVAAKEAEMVIAGTPNYFAPEVAAKFARPGDERPLTSAADVFSLALALRNALEPETQEDVPGGAVESFIEQRADAIPPLPRSKDLRFLEPHLKRWLSLDPAERPTADELAEELSVLTRPEERRRRTVALLRWLVPLTVTVAVVFASVVYVLNARAERQRVEAEQARMTASDLRQDLKMTEEQRQRLEQDVSQIRQSYQRSKLSRRDLAGQLARTEGQLKLARRHLGTSEQLRRELRKELATRTEELEAERTRAAGLQTNLTDAQRELEAARQRVTSLEEQLESTRTALADAVQARDAAETEVDKLRANRTELEQQLAQARSRAESAEASSKRLEERAAAAERERARLSRELARVERELKELERKSAERRRSAPRAETGGEAPAEERAAP